MKLKFAFFIILSFAIQAWAKPANCFKNQAEYEAMKDKLPALIQEVPFYFTAEKQRVMLVAVVSAAGRVQFVNGNLRFYFNATHGVDNVKDQQVLEICADEKSLYVGFPNGVPEEVEIKSATTLKAHGKLNMTRTNKETFNKVLKIIAGASEAGDEPAKSTSSGGQVQ